MNEKYLPLGSVILLKKASKRIMIIGYAIKSNDSPNKLWDYLGCLYPEGVQTSDKNLLFDHKDIETIYALGYSDDEHKRYVKFMNDTIQEKGFNC